MALKVDSPGKQQQLSSKEKWLENQLEVKEKKKDEESHGVIQMNREPGNKSLC